MSSVPLTMLQLQQLGREYLEARKQLDRCLGHLAKCRLDLDTAERTLIDGIMLYDEDEDAATAVLVDHTCLAVKEEHWECAPGERLQVIRTMEVRR